MPLLLVLGRSGSQSTSTKQPQPVCADACRRFYLEIEGKQRFKVLDCWEQDGYRVARPQYFSDSPLPSASDAQANLASMCQSVDQLANIWLDKVRWVTHLTLGAYLSVTSKSFLLCSSLSGCWRLLLAGLCKCECMFVYVYA